MPDAVSVKLPVLPALTVPGPLTATPRLGAGGTIVIVSLALAALIALPGLRAGKPKMLDLGGVVTFVGFLVVALTADATVAHDVTRYARGIAAAALSLLAFASLLFVPFTEQYARESVPQEAWGSARFKAINRKLTVMWALIFAGMVPFHIVAGAVNTQRANIILNFVVPCLMVLWGAKHSTGEVDGSSATVTQRAGA